MINRVILVGRLTKDVEVRTTQSGLAVASFTVACDRNRKKEESSQEQTADFISCVAWRQSAEFLGKYALKGTLIGIDGKIQTRSYENAQGTKVYVTEVLADSVQILEKKSDGSAPKRESRAPAGNVSVKIEDVDTSPSSLDFGDSSVEITSDELPF